ncbi:MAG: hypothetical protein IT304_01515 [Dehalococcoidia bacterium]|nr:hypothetical protein [Dehalococcoidia bacterium]
MSQVAPVRAVLMSSEIHAGGTGFHRLVFKVDGGRAGMTNVTVLISQDAHRKLLAQLNRARCQPLERAQLLKHWARWAIGLRQDELGVIPAAITITASDIDDFGAYASDLASTFTR